MTAFSTIIEKECEWCHKKFIAKVPRAKYCCKQCKAKALAKPGKKDKDTGLFTKECPACKKTFTTATKNVRMCPECRKESDAKSYRKWRENHPEWQKDWNKAHPESIKESRNKWEAKNPEKVAAMEKAHAARRSEKRAQDRRERAIQKQDVLKETAVKYNPPKWLDQYEFADSIGVVRLTANYCRCTACGEEFYIAKKESSACRNLVRYAAAGKRPCPYCGDAPIGHSVSCYGSAYEHEIMKLYPNFTVRGYKPEWLDGKEIDLYDPVAKVGLEFHGLFMHSERRSKEYSVHKLKADRAEAAGVQLLQIFESEWVQRRECVIDRLDAIFHRELRRVPARKLSVRILEGEKDHSEGSRFMEENHVQGSAPFQWGVALMDGEEMMAACFFRYGTGYASGGHVDGTGRYWELNRFATRLHVCVQGGISRCMAAFWKAHPDVEEVFSFADRRWTCPSRSAYSSSGFEEVGRQPPNYMYTDLDPKHELKSKQFMRKSRIRERNPDVFSEDRTEYEMAKELGWYRIWDAGKIKYRVRRPK